MVETVQSEPSLEKRISPGDAHSKWAMLEVRISGSTGKLVRAIGLARTVGDVKVLLPGCVPQESESLAVGRPGRFGWVLDVGDSVYRDASAWRLLGSEQGSPQRNCRTASDAQKHGGFMHLS